MISTTFYWFLARKRFKLRDISDGHVSIDEFRAFEKVFSKDELFYEMTKAESFRKFKLALLLSSYVAESRTDDFQLFDEYSSRLNEEEWQYVIRHSPYANVWTRLQALQIINASLVSAYVDICSAVAGAEAASDHRSSRETLSSTHIEKIRSGLLVATTLYASYIDLSRDIARKAGVHGKTSYSSALKRIIGKNSAAHSFIKDLRNFMLHYGVVNPTIMTEIAEVRRTYAIIDSHSLVASGFDWKADASKYFSENPRIDILKVLDAVIRDVHRSITFHKKVSERYLPNHYRAHDAYLATRLRATHKKKANMVIERAFRIRTSIIMRLVGESTLQQLSESQLSDEIVGEIILNLADRFKNLADAERTLICKEINEFLRKRRSHGLDALAPKA